MRVVVERAKSRPGYYEVNLAPLSEAPVFVWPILQFAYGIPRDDVLGLAMSNKVLYVMIKAESKWIGT